MPIYLDIETIPLAFQPRAWPKDYAKVRPHSLDPLRARVLCLGLAVDDGPVRTYYAEHPEDEYDVLFELWHAIRKAGRGAYPLVAHNAIGFDRPMLEWRARVAYVAKPTAGLHGLCQALYQAKPWDSRWADTVRMLPTYGVMGARRTPGGKGTSRKLDDVGVALGLWAPPGPDDLSGAFVLDAFVADKGPEIREYCAEDVAKVRALYRALTGRLHPMEGA
jgi:hypothetical protein